MTARFERSCNENDQVVWLSETDPSNEQAPAHESTNFTNPLSRLYCRSVEAVQA
ncbi:MAG: hypothetical protein L3K19_07040 [Thermoplasmata archaeon]|nr:hypothetical protein [Thermoplasmata archaeon]